MAAVQRLVDTRVRGGLLAAGLLGGAAYLVLVANLTVWPSGGVGHRNLVPFRTISRYLSWGLAGEVQVRNLAGNLVMLVPFGILLAVTTRWTLLRGLATVAALSAAIELWQLAFATGRSVDVDDLILNTAGGAIGLMVGLAGLHLLERIAPTLVGHHPATGC